MSELQGTSIPRIPLLALALLLALAAVVSVSVPPAAAEGGEWKNVHLIYTTDIKGKIEPCG
ncbi:MAG: hypothetical protein ABIK96_10465 [bacterium]|nr:hypothetical protein [bacterium]